MLYKRTKGSYEKSRSFTNVSEPFTSARSIMHGTKKKKKKSINNVINLSLIAVKLPFKTSVGFHNFLARGPINLQPFERNTLSKKFRFFQFLRGCVCRASMPAIPQDLLPSDSLDKKDTRGGNQPAEQRYDTLAVSLDTFIPFETILLRNARVTSLMQKLDAYLECFSTAEQKTGKEETGWKRSAEKFEKEELRSMIFPNVRFGRLEFL